MAQLSVEEIRAKLRAHITPRGTVLPRPRKKSQRVGIPLYKLNRLIARAKARQARTVARSVAVERLMSQALTYAKAHQRQTVVVPVPRDFSGEIIIRIRIE